MIQKRPSQKTRLVIRVGVTGHNFKDLGVKASNAILPKIQEVLEKIQETADALHDHCKGLYANEAPSLRIISALGDGAELLVTRKAVSQGFELQCLLPVEHTEYKKWLSQESVSLFEDLWQSESVKVELDGTLNNPISSRESAGQAMLRQCDLLIAVWDGKPTDKDSPGAVVREALARNIPIVWIESRGEHRISLWERSDNAREVHAEKLGHLLERLMPIFSLPAGVSRKQLKRFLAEKQPKPIPIYRKFRNLFSLGWRKRLKKILGANNFDDIQSVDRWSVLEKPNNLIGLSLDEGCRDYLNRADDLANAYGDIYRSLFIVTYALGALAVLSAFFGIYYPVELHWIFWIELALILGILGLVWLGNKRLHLHERWIDYRLLAEGFRQMQYLMPLARVTPAFEVPAHLEEDPGRTWFNWYYRAVARELGMTSARMDKPFLEAYQRVLADSVREQVSYHAKTSAMMELAHERLHSLVVKCLFPATLVACLFHLVPEKYVSPWLGELATGIAVLLLSLCAVVLPAMGAAVEGISHQGEFERIGRRSKALRSRLSALLNGLSSAGRTMSSKELGAQAEYFCQIQLLEQADWRAAFVSKPLTPS